MPSQYDLSKTMRIDIHPDVMGDIVDVAPEQSWTLSNADDVEFIARENREIERSHEYVKILQSIYDAVIITDNDGGIVDFNFRALDFFSTSERDLTGLSILDIISGADEALLDAVRSNLTDHRYTLIEALCLRLDETTFPAEIAVSYIDLDFEGELCFFVRDITVRRQAQDALEDAVTRLEAHDKARTQFVSNVSHELRTPLTSIIYAVSNMLRGIIGNLPDRANNYLRMIEGDSKRLLNTVNDILDISKIESNTLELHHAVLPLGSLMSYSAESLRVQAAAKSIELFISTSKKEYFVDGDIGRMERLIINVVGNAVKFTPEDGQITVEIMDDPSGNGNAMILVTDSGVGIPPDSIDKVMMRYFTVGIQPSGSGLGLAISKEIVELHGGSLDLISPPPGNETGTQVSISLPTVLSPHVLIVYKDASACSVLENHLASCGYRISSDTEGGAIVDLINSAQPDVIVIDVSGAPDDLVAIIAGVKGRTDFRKTPVIVLTDTALRSSQEEILNTLNIPVLTKPLDESTLLQCLAGVFLGVL
ncbi:MAG: hybrid sensor histidine kinase/response regulator [Kiritimatiellae bacterium]|nr:hybrid sensor histidine kinase/response regulator [Kiritimatiellia bacterium]